MHANLIGGAWVEAPSARPNVNPSDIDDVVGHDAEADEAQAAAAVDAAAAAFPAWSTTRVQTRADALARIAFGPVACVIAADDPDHALANDSELGLAAGICTTSLKHATHFKRHAQAGMVMVNLPTAGVDYHEPFGGRKAASHGPREQGRHAAEFSTTAKTACTAADTTA